MSYGANDNELIYRIKKMQTSPVSRVFGLDRGTAIDRIYIESFLDECREKIFGDCLEIAEDTYTRRYGGDKVTHSMKLHYTDDKNAIRGDLVSGDGIEECIVDCAIITQTMMFVKDVRKCVTNIYRMLKPGGHALLTVSGISQVSTYDRDRWGHFYGFYEDGIHELFDSVFGRDNVNVKTYGNVKTAIAFLYGLCAEDLSAEDFKFIDKDYPVIYGIDAKKVNSL
ncbi:Methyltransferase domain-containing protein [Butyrivibrio proteoclasticus]|uniref:Methyltransferase domain-containing protein n=1 Tax=Butyrivibrio proteoclasticus TaxID=43305 RepID=A0A1I5VXA3_9FIRM|nr:methyltransferase domain-containing protein [Butyrivibrio proteoclasticus]SFQ11636.1 Methyltransferase domain-containing protein [Butyrivibrio proteoclasticus]